MTSFFHGDGNSSQVIGSPEIAIHSAVVTTTMGSRDNAEHTMSLIYTLSLERVPVPHRDTEATP